MARPTSGSSCCRRRSSPATIRSWSRLGRRRAGCRGNRSRASARRGPVTLRTRGRAVTREDYEYLAREAAPEVARVRCLEAGAGAEPGTVRILVVPTAADDPMGALQIEQLIPSEESLAHIRDYLDERRPIGARVVIEPPTYMGVTVVARLQARPR